MIDIKRDPYFDDFDAKKNYTNILFKPGYPVQVRELNQIQSIQHHQLERFAEHIFKHGSMVEGQGVTYSKTPFITIQAISPGNSIAVDINFLAAGARLYGETSGVEANIILVDNSPDVITIYLNYIKSGPSGLNSFAEGENVLLVDDSNNVYYSVKMRCPGCEGSGDSANIPVKGYGALWTIPDAVYYVHGYFVTHETIMIVGERHSDSSEIYEVGFRVDHRVVTTEDDSSLFDNTLGYPNFGAPGADRARMVLIPEIRYESIEDSEFIVLAKMVNGNATYMKKKTEYSAIMDMIAQRTYDESGNYTVIPFKVSLRDHLNRNDNGGLYTAEQGGSDDFFVATVSAGKAYIKGYQLETIGETPVTMDKARDTKTFRSYYTQFTGLSYVLIKPEPGSFPIANDLEIDSIYGNLTIDLHDGPTSGGIATGNVIGYMKPYDVEIHEFGNEPVYKLFFTEIRMNEGNSYVQVKSMKRDGTIFFNASTVEDELTERPKVYNSNETALIWKIRNALKTTRDVDNNDMRSLSYTGREKFTAVLDGNGTYAWNANKGEYFLPFNPVTTIAAFISNTGVATYIALTNQVSTTSDRLSVNFGSAYGGNRLVLLHSVMKSAAAEKTKTILRITDTGRTIDSAGRVELRKGDLYELISVKRYTVSNPATKTNIDISTLTVDNGQRDFAYLPASFRVPEIPVSPESIRYEAVYDYYEHSKGDFFSIDSYKKLLTDPTREYYRSDIPVYKSKNGIEYPLSDCLDFRPLILSDQAVNIEQPMLNGQVISDLEVYLPRIDLLVADRYGNIKQKKGDSSENPTPPPVATDGSEMALYEVHQDPYVLSLSSGVRLKFVDNKRYTMRDIGRLEERLKNVEYYTTFSLMELDLEQTSVKDEFGFDRFKNGFLADNFSNFQASNLLDPEFRAAIDQDDSTLRPGFKIFECGLKFDSDASTNFKRHGDVILIDYNEEEYLSQPYCTKHLSINPYFIFNKEGKLILDPPYDNWVDLNQKPDLIVDAELPQIETENPVGQRWKSWNNVNRASSELGSYATDITLKPYMRSIPVKFYATGMKKNTRLYCFFDNVDVTANCRPLRNGSAYGSPIVTDENGNVSGEFLIPDGKFFAGQKEFVLCNDSTNTEDEDLLFTRAEAVFWSGGVDLSKQETTLNIITPIIPKPPTTPPPAPVPTVAPIVFIPPTNPPPTTQAPRPAPTFAPTTAAPTARPTTTPRPTTTRATTVPPTTSPPQTTPPPPASCFTFLWEINDKYGIPDIHHTTSRTYINKNTEYGKIVEGYFNICSELSGFRGDGTPAAATIAHVKCMANKTNVKVPFNLRICNGAILDPVAQSFYVDNSCFITSADIFFHTVSSDDLIFVWIVDMLNGYPTKKILGEVTLQPHECATSTDGSAATGVRFPVPIYIESGKEYAIVVGGRNPDTRIWISKLGEKDLGTGTSIETQPSLGSLFKSQNASTWTASQYEDMKFKIYRARFKEREATFSFVNKRFSDETIEMNPFETQAGSNRVRIRCQNHAMNSGDSLRVFMGQRTAISLQVTSGQLSIGQKIVTNTGSGFIRSITEDGSTYSVELLKIQGNFLMNQPFSADPFTITHPEELINSSIRIPVSNTPSLEARGTVKTTFNPSMNGIPMGILNKELEVIETDSVESFIVETQQPATMTGFTGGSVVLNPNKRYDGFNISGSYLANGSSESWEFRGIGHEINGEFTFDDYQTMPPVIFEPQKDTLLDQPYKLVNSENAASRLNDGPSMRVNVDFTTPDDLISPIINLGTFSFIGISNIVDWNDETTFNVSPNGTNRLNPETNPLDGDALFKYVTRDIALAEPALDLRLFLDVHKTDMNDFDIYVKRRGPEDITPMESLPWVKVENVWKDFVCTSRDEYREIDCTMSELMPLEFDGIKDFNMFRIKIVGKSKNTALPPLFKMLRVIAVT